MLARWQRWRRTRVRYRALGLPPPRRVRVSSPYAAAIAAGIGAGVRWLQRHPETHRPLFVFELTQEGLVDAALDAARRAAGLRVPMRDIARALRSIVARPPAALPPQFCATTTGRVPLERAPLLAATEGMLEAAAEPDLFAPHIRALVREVAPLDTRGPVSFLIAVLRARVELAADLYAHADYLIESAPPRCVVDAKGRLHRIGGAAAYWRDGFSLSFLHGTRVPDRIDRGEVTIEDILGMHAAEVRRTLIELYERGDRGRFLRDAAFEVLHADRDALGHPRRLLRIALHGDEAYIGVEVTNSTAEPDGSHRTYVLRVPPWLRTCRAAVAWTFGLAEHAYAPDVET
jgi:hypothetical protein